MRAISAFDRHGVYLSNQEYLVVNSIIADPTSSACQHAALKRKAQSLSANLLLC